MVTRDELDAAIAKMRRFVFKLIRKIPKGMEIEDVYQDLILHVVIVCYTKFDPSRSELTSFVGSVAKWRMAELYRVWSKEKRALEFKDELIGDVPEKVAPYARDLIWIMSKDLPAKQRIVIRNVADGLTEEEVGKRLGITRQAVSLLLRKGIATIRQQYTWDWWDS